MVTLVPCKQALRCHISTTLQECISKSAIQTKFESHAVSGLKVAQTVKVIMEQIVGCAFQQRLATFYLLGLFSCNNYSWTSIKWASIKRQPSIKRPVTKVQE